MKKIMVLILFILTGCATTTMTPPMSFPDFTYMNKDNKPGVVIVVPPSEIRTLREMVIENRYRIDKVEITANKALSTANTALENQNIFNNLLQNCLNKVEDYRLTCEAMFNKMLKK